MNTTSVKELVCEKSKDIFNEGLTQQTFGNVSSRIDDELIAITPSATPYPNLKPSKIPVVNLKGQIIENTGKKVSTETQIHLEIYRERDDINAVVHTHSPFATVFACLGEKIRPYHNTLAHVGGEIRVTEYANNGTDKLARLARKQMIDRRAVLLRNHGVLCGGKSLQDAHYVATIVEFCAKIQFLSCMIGNPELVAGEDLDFLSEHYHHQLVENQ